MHSTDNLDDGYMGSGKRLWNSFRKHGRLTHFRQILEYWPDRESLRRREEELVNDDRLIDPMCMNLTLGGGYGWEFINRDSNRQREKNRKGHARMKFLRENDPEWVARNKKNSSLGNLKAYAEGRKKEQDGFSQAFRGRTHTDETKALIGSKSKILVGDRNGSFGSKWMTDLSGVSQRVPAMDIPLRENEGWRFGRLDIRSSKS